MSAIGLMDGAFFVGRKEILDWLNSTLQLNLAKIEDTSNGAVACQLLDIMHPGTVPMHKVNWNAKQNFEIVSNYKILQSSFDKLRIEKHVDVDRLISGRYMDNLEFMQWFKRFFEMSVHDLGDYDAVAQRSKGKGGAQLVGSSKAPSKVSGGSSSVKNPTSSSSKPTLSRVPSTGSKPSGPGKESTHAPEKVASKATSHSGGRPGPTTSSSATSNSHQQELVNLHSEVDRLRESQEESTRAFSELRLEMDGLEKEKDFYFDKLRDIEVLLQEVEDAGQGTELTASLFKILYATAEGFEIRDTEPENGQPEHEETTRNQNEIDHTNQHEEEREEFENGGEEDTF